MTTNHRPFAITLDVGSSRANKTGSWRTERPVYVDLLPPSILACRMPRAQIHYVHGGGHLCLLDRAAEVGPVVSAFLRSLEGTAINEVAELG